MRRREKRAHLGVNVAFRTVPADVNLVLGCFLVHRVDKVDGVGVFLPPVSPHQNGTEDQQNSDHCGTKDELSFTFSQQEVNGRVRQSFRGNLLIGSTTYRATG